MEKIKKTGYDVLYLAACALNDTVPERSRTDAMDMDSVVKFCRKHSVSGLCSFALEAAGAADERLTRLRNSAIRKIMMLDAERRQICSFFEENGIWYMPLKGVYMKEYYPKLGMREMCDNDILIDASRIEEADAFMLARGYEKKNSSDMCNEWEYSKKPLYNFELHRGLFSDIMYKKWRSHYQDVTDRLVSPSEDSFLREFTPEDFYIFMINHEYKHFNTSGTGIRSLTDTYVYMKKFGDVLDMDYICAAAEKLGMGDFERINRSIAMKLLSSCTPEKLTDEEEDILMYFFTSGTYGTREHRVKNIKSKLKEQGGSDSNASYIFHRIFPPMDFFALYYPFFYRHKILLPVGWGIRLVKGIFGNGDKIREEIKIISGKD